RFLAATPTFRHLLFFYSVVSLFGYGLQQWQPAFFMRTHGLETGEIGTWFAIVYGAGGLIGTYWGGEWVSRHAARDEGIQLKLGAVVYATFSLVSSLIYMTSSHHVAFALMAVGAVGGAATIGPL